MMMMIDLLYSVRFLNLMKPVMCLVPEVEFPHRRVRGSSCSVYKILFL